MNCDELRLAVRHPPRRVVYSLNKILYDLVERSRGTPSADLYCLGEAEDANACCARDAPDERGSRVRARRWQAGTERITSGAFVFKWRMPGSCCQRCRQ